MDTKEKDEEVIGLKHIIIYYLKHWKLFLYAGLFTLIPAILYLIYYPKTYEMMARIKVQDDMEMGSGNASLGDAAGLMKSFGLNPSSGPGINIDDEQAVLGSHDLLTKVVTRLGLNVTYVKPFTWGYEMYENLPFTLTPDPKTQREQDRTVEFVVKADVNGRLSVKAEASDEEFRFEPATLPATLAVGEDVFVLNYGPAFQQGQKEKLYITARPAGWVADDLADALMVDTYSDNSNVLEFVYEDYERQRGKDILNTVIAEYNLQADSIKDVDASKSVAFLEKRIETVVADLSKVERLIEDYKIQNKMTDLEYDVQFYVEQMKDLQTKIIELETQIQSVKFMEDFVNDPSNKYNLIPVLMNVQEGEKGGSITTYNEALIERQRMLHNSKEDNPLLITMDKQLDKMRESVCLTIRNAKATLDIALADVKKKEGDLLSKMGSVPTQERTYLDYKRQQEIYQGVYLVLLQKREEEMLKIGRDMNRGLVIDAAFSKSLPIAPRKLYAAIAMMLFTIAVPVGYLFVKEQYLSLKEAYLKERDKQPSK